MDSFDCSFCHKPFPLIYQTFKEYSFSFSSENGTFGTGSSRKFYDDAIGLGFFKCPYCNKITIKLAGLGTNTKGIVIPVLPSSNALIFPDYVPKAISDDYKEAYSILYSSPKASATLSRRCLQGIIRDFWDIKDDTLYKEISKLKPKVPPDEWKVIDSIRSIGNIGAHMEYDVNTIIDIEPDEAEKLLKLIELFIKQWYINRHEREELFNNILDIADDKQNQKKSS